MPKPSLADRLFLAAESREIPQHVAFLAVFEKPKGAPVDFLQRLMDDLREIREFAAPWNYRLKHPRLRSIAPSWEEVTDTEIDLDFHLRLDSLPAPGGERQLGVLVSRLHSYPLDLTKPLWEFHLIDGLENDRFGIYFKVHHAITDGVGGMQRLQQMLTSNPSDSKLRPLWSVGPDGHALRKRPRLADRLTEGVHTAAGLAQAGIAMVRPGSDLEIADLARPFAVPSTAFNGRVGQHRRAATQVFEFDRFRAVARAAKVTHNDVFLAVCAGGLRRYLLDVAEVPDRPLIAGTPVNVRASDDRGTTNAFTMTVMSLATDVEDPLERLQAIHRSSGLAKSRLAMLAPSVIKNYAALFMGPFVAANVVGLGGRTRPPYNVSISNVPGPIDVQYMAGARLEAMYPIALLYHGVGLFIAALTLSGKVCLGFTGDRDALPHLQRLAVFTGEAFDEIEAALGVAR